MNILQSKDFLAGLAAVLIGFFVIVTTSGYGFGTPRQMGPGFFPLTLGVMLSLLGVVIALGALRRQEKLPKLNLRPYILVPFAILIFALLIPRVGFGPAGVATVMLAGIAEPDTRKLHLLLLAMGLVPAVWLLFAVGLGVQVAFIDWSF
ncbi:MAG: tripartite tricarboxylate transporter TctB family protein [Paracoccaceae bacterium]|uniref:tripartite tricarboxylate transporter TctB family protein n=1 Tax=Seohaeicola saemankumensis TaxID=481181 RepID=UPI001E60DC17|nr:tripartite tricarboxylate transporter TctB family protein [Seohaeicola saemankumensis]MCD1627271.1 tripartite tricarboxylate transporter TctB family protein [Seohaeicola saemankumensis]